MTNYRPILPVALLGAAVFLVGCSPRTDDSKVVRVAANLPLSGPLATYGDAVLSGASMAIEDLQRAGSSVTISIDWQDNAGDPPTAVSVMQQQLRSNPDIYVSGVKPQSMAIMDRIVAAGLPHFVWIFDKNINTSSDNNFRTWVSYKIEPQIYFDYAAGRSARKVAVVYVQLPHTVEAYQQTLVPMLEAEGAKVLTQAFEFGKRDFRDIATRIRDFGPDLIVLNGFQSELVGLVRAMRPFDLISEGNTVATYDMLDAAEVLGADELEGILVVAPLFVTRPDEPVVSAWTAEFVDEYQKAPLYTDAFAYDMVTAIHNAARRLQLPATSEEWMVALRETDTVGITGPIRFDTDGDMMTPLELGVYRSGVLVPLVAEQNVLEEANNVLELVPADAGR